MLHKEHQNTHGLTSFDGLRNSLWNYSLQQFGMHFKTEKTEVSKHTENENYAIFTRNQIIVLYPQLHKNIMSIKKTQYCKKKNGLLH